jgi:polar amino acid transport system permease protein
MFNISEYHLALCTIPLGIVVTLKYAIISAIVATIMGSFIALGKISRVVVFRIAADFWISIIRGTPILLQLSFFYFALPAILNTEISVTVAGILCFSINSSAYVAEIVRGGILSIDKGQTEASESLNIYGFYKYWYIILPQVVRNITPSLVNEVINLIKESAIISVFGDMDLIRRAQVVTAQYYTYFAPLIVAGVCYYVIIQLLSVVAKKLEHKLHYYD